MLFDSHAHLDDEAFDADREEVIARALANGLTGMVNPGSCMKSSAAALALAQQHAAIYAAVGIHPHDADSADEAAYEQLLCWAQHPKVVAIGEIGLDYHYDFSPRSVQQDVFVKQLALARECDLPVILHDREAHGDILRLVKEQGQGVRGVFHCFSGSLEMAREVLNLGFYLSVGGTLTFKNAAKLPEIVKEVPFERLLLETDSPYLTPVPYRGRRNEPLHVRLVAEKVAELRGLSVEEVARQTTSNTCRCFGITQ
jgi:TatD DNase family protein